MIVRTTNKLPARYRRLRFVLAAVTAVLAVSAVLCSLLAVRYQERIIEASRYNSAFDFSQTSVELLRLQTALQDDFISADASAVEMRFNILRNRLSVIEANDLLDDVERAGLIDNLRSALGEIGPLIANRPTRDEVRTIIDRLRPFVSPALQLASRAHSEAGDRILANQRDLKLIFAGICSFTMALVAFGAVLVGFILHQNRKLDKVARIDALTGLANRLAFNTALAETKNSQTAVVLVDVDHFKALNDTLGHDAGDRLLTALSRRLREMAGDAVAVARIGGDEFALLYGGADAELASLLAADRIIQAMEAPFRIADREVAVTVTVGTSLARHAEGAEMLFNDADIALYAAKLAGRGQHLAFEPAMKRDLLHRRRLMEDLRHAVDNGELFLLYQPIVETGTGCTRGFEALLRWRHPELGLVPPSEFIPLAEAGGQIKAIGVWVLEEACRQAASWPDHIFVAVNVSARQLGDTALVGRVRGVMGSAGLKRGRLAIEITESTLIDNDAVALAVLGELKETGCRIALDDFGTGYASLSYLRRFPFDKLKIDQSFFRQANDADSASIVHMVAGLAKQLGLTVVAEGIETDEQHRLVQSAGCQFSQGYRFDRPLSPEATHVRLAREFREEARSLAMLPRLEKSA